MQFEKIHNKGQARLFKNRYLERLTKTHPLVIWSIYLPMIVSMIYYSAKFNSINAGKIILIFTAGILFWTFFEYMIHRYLFHFVTSSVKTLKIVYLIHGNHHEYPRDKQRLFMPPLPSILVAGGVFCLIYFLSFITGTTTTAFVFFPGFMFGYLLYGTMHYAIHSVNPPFKWMKPLWRNHHLHHYKEQEKGFGVSSTLWDHVFGTMFDQKKENEPADKARDLMFISKRSKNAAS